MAQSMTKSHQHIPSVTLFDDANIQHWQNEKKLCESRKGIEQGSIEIKSLAC